MIACQDTSPKHDYIQVYDCLTGYKSKHDYIQALIACQDTSPKHDNIASILLLDRIQTYKHDYIQVYDCLSGYKSYT